MNVRHAKSLALVLAGVFSLGSARPAQAADGIDLLIGGLTGLAGWQIAKHYGAGVSGQVAAGFGGLVLGTLVSDAIRTDLHQEDHYAMTGTGYRALHGGQGMIWVSQDRRYRGRYWVRRYQHRQYGYECRRLGHRVFDGRTNRPMGRTRYTYYCWDSRRNDWAPYRGQTQLLIQMGNSPAPGFPQQPPMMQDPYSYQGPQYDQGFNQNFDQGFDQGFDTNYDPYGDRFDQSGYPEAAADPQFYNDPEPNYNQVFPQGQRQQPSPRRPVVSEPAPKAQQPIVPKAPPNQAQIAKAPRNSGKPAIGSAEASFQPVKYSEPARNQVAKVDAQAPAGTSAASVQQSLVMEVGDQTAKKMKTNLASIEDDETRFRYLDDLMKSMRDYGASKNGELFFDKEHTIALAKTFKTKENRKKAAQKMADMTRNFSEKN